MAVKIIKGDSVETSIVSGVTMEGYEKPSTSSAIEATDSLNEAIGKLETSLDDKASTDTISSHISNKSNPHSVTKAQVGLGNVDNTSDANKPISTATQTALNTKVTIPSGGSDGQVLKKSGTSVVWGSDNNTIYSAGTGISLSGTTFSNSGVRSIATGSANGTISVNTNGTTADVAVKGLGSNAYTSTEYVPTSTKGSANGVASLDANGKVPSSQLPSYVDDVLEYTAKSNFPSTGETGKIYVDTATNLTYRWSGSAYVEISPSIALGETSSTAYAGDKGKANADAISSHTSNKSNPHSVTKAQVGLGNVDNTSDADKPISTATQTALNAKYVKPSGGIPKTDLASAVQTSLGKADTALQSHQDISGKENTSNKVTAWSSTTTDAHYPSEKLVKSALDGKANSSHTHDDRYYTESEIDTKLSGKANTFSVTNGGNTASWGSSVTVGTVAGTNLTFTMPSNPNTDTKVTAVGNHYTPSADSSSALSVDASSTTSASWASTSLVTGVNISRDAKGHVTGLTVDSIRMPANPNTNTTYSAGTGISLSGTTFSNSGVRSVTAGSSANQISVNTGGTTSTITVNNVASATSATKATQDSDGNQINTTYLKATATGTTYSYTGS